MPKFFFKSNQQLISHCECDNEPAMSTCQMDCPWCGCGWLFSCSKCSKAFTFAEVRETDLSLEQIAKREASTRGIQDSIGDDDIADWVLNMSQIVGEFEVGDQVVYIDGEYLKSDAESVEFDGYFAAHKFEKLPHAEALATNPDLLDEILGQPSYWFDRELPDDE
ncbi:MAG: hypothetical protein AB8G99_16080 [Planctomycetaceae bacterium]